MIMAMDTEKEIQWIGIHANKERSVDDRSDENNDYCSTIIKYFREISSYVSIKFNLALNSLW